MGKEEDVYDELELSEEELLEEQQDMAARIIQRRYRMYEAKKTLQQMIRQNFVKIRDRENNKYIYKNKTTGEVSDSKPLNLGQSDLKTPRTFTAPDDYRPGYVDNEGYALLICVNRFTSSRIEDFSKHKEADHGLLEHYMSHEFICKIPAENVIPVLNPTLSMLKDALDRLRRMCKRRSYLFVYISTHVLTIRSRIKEFKDEDCFLCCKDTVWRSTNQAAQTSMPLSTFAKALNDILAEEKVVAVNMCHNKPPQKSVFKSRYLYPPPDCLTRLADMANCAVIGSCNFGTQISTMKDHHPPSPTDAINDLKDEDDEIPHDTIDDSKVAPMDDILPLSEDKMDNIVYNRDIVRNYQKEWLRDLNLQSVTKPIKPQKPTLRWKKAPTAEEIAAAEALAAKKGDYNEGDDNTEEEKKEDEANKDAKKDIFSKKPKKAKKAAKVKVDDEEEENKKVKEKSQEELDEEAGQALGIQMAMPTKYEKWGYAVSLRYWKVKKAAFPAVRAYTNYQNARKLSSGGAPCQKSLLTKKKHSLFGKIFIDAITGKLKVRSGNHITAQEVFLYLHKKLREGIKTMTAADDEGLFPRQDPVLFVPKNNPEAAEYPVCCVCGPPAPPDAPFVIRVGMYSVLLEWDMVPFDGVGPTKHRIYMRNNTKLFYDWTVAPGGENIPHIPGASSIRFSVNHLPLGVPTEFCVASCNIGGWSKLSPPSITATPGQDLLPHSAQKTWKFIAQGGPLAVIDRLAKYPEHRHDHLTGFKYLIVFAQREGEGFSRLNIREKASAMCLKALKTFPLDDEISAGAFRIIGYCLQGYMFKKLTNLLIRDGLLDIIDEHMIQFRNDSRVVKSVLWLNRALPKDRKIALPDQTPLPFISPVDEDDENSVA